MHVNKYLLGVNTGLPIITVAIQATWAYIDAARTGENDVTSIDSREQGESFSNDQLHQELRNGSAVR